MAQVARRARTNFSTSQTMYAPEISGHPAAVDLPPATPVQLRADNKVYPSSGDTLANGTCHGFTVTDLKAGEAVAIHGLGTRIGYGDGTLPAGALLYADTVAGRLSTTPTTGGVKPVAMVIGATQDIFVLGPSINY